jgi:hypothetical protein
MSYHSEGIVIKEVVSTLFALENTALIARMDITSVSVLGFQE